LTGKKTTKNQDKTNDRLFIKKEITNLYGLSVVFLIVAYLIQNFSNAFFVSAFIVGCVLAFIGSLLRMDFKKIN